jgi:hypothetical protein
VLLNAGLLAFSELGVDNCCVRVLDTQGTATGARDAAQALMREGVKLVMGPLFTHEVQAVAPIFYRARVPVLAFSNNPKAWQKGVFLLGLSPKDEITTLLAFGFSKPSQRFLALLPDGAYGEIVLQMINRSFAERQKHLLAATAQAPLPRLEVIRYRPGEMQAEELRECCAATSFDAAIVLEQDLSTAASFVEVLRKCQSSALIFGPSSWGDSAFATRPELEGAYLAVPTQGDDAPLRKRYRQAFSGELLFPLGLFASDAVSILARIPDFSRLTSQWFEQEESFLGASGEFCFEKNGQARRTLRVCQLKGGALVPVASAPLP